MHLSVAMRRRARDRTAQLPLVANARDWCLLFVPVLRAEGRREMRTLDQTPAVSPSAAGIGLPATVPTCYLASSIVLYHWEPHCVRAQDGAE